MKLNNPRRRDGSDNMYCGPAALCAITGESYETVRESVNVDVRDRPHNRGITGMHGFEIRRVLEKFGYTAIETDYDFIYEKKNLNQYLKQRPFFEKNNVLFIELTSHFVTVKGDNLVDNHTKVPVHIAIAPWKRAKVRKVWVIKD